MPDIIALLILLFVLWKVKKLAVKALVYLVTIALIGYLVIAYWEVALSLLAIFVLIATIAYLSTLRKIKKTCSPLIRCGDIDGLSMYYLTLDRGDKITMLKTFAPALSAKGDGGISFLDQLYFKHFVWFCSKYKPVGASIIFEKNLLEAEMLPIWGGYKKTVQDLIGIAKKLSKNKVEIQTVVKENKTSVDLVIVRSNDAVAEAPQVIDLD